MSRVFTKNLANYMTLGTSGLGSLLSGAAVLSVHALITAHSTDIGNGDNAIVTVLSNSTTIGVQLNLDGTVSPPVARINARSVSTDAKQSKSGATAVALQTPTFVGGVVDLAGDAVQVYRNGVLDGSASVVFANTTFTLGTPLEGDTIGGYRTPPVSTTDQFDGEISEVAIWTTGLTGPDFATLATGAAANTVQSGSLVYYVKLTGTASPEVPTVGTPLGTIVGTVPAVPLAVAVSREDLVAQQRML
jgi:Concanavalin A-like lectin/glucanases superfamily